jgi:hypothetical protein
MDGPTREQLAHQDMIRSTLAQLQSEASSLDDRLAAVTDLRGIASLCDAVWKQLQNTDLFLHDILVDERWSPDARVADPLEAIREYLAHAELQVKGVMAEDYEVDIARKRLTMATALDHTVLDLLDGYLQGAMVAAAGNRGTGRPGCAQPS